MILNEIFAKTKQDLFLKKEQRPYKELEAQALDKKPKNFFDFFSKENTAFQIIAELKKASPSKGVIRENFKPLDIALNYEKNGACALSVLTEPHYFQGHLQYLKQVHQVVKLPLLRKDFIFDEYQILQALVYGADFILLIAKMLSAKELKRLFDFARALKLEVLLEVHNEEDLEKALFVNANIIGINHRNLDDFTMDMNLSQKLVPLVPKHKFIVAESGLNDKKILRELSQIGVNAFLIGAYFMQQNDEGKALKALFE